MLKLRRYKNYGDGKAVKQFAKLERQILEGKITLVQIEYTSLQLIDAIYDYVHDLENYTSSEKSHTLKCIMKADPLIDDRVYDYIPGTGDSSHQFYKYARAIAFNRDTLDIQKITSENIILVILSYLHDILK